MFFKTDTAKIKRWREERHWSQEHLAQLAGVGLRTLQRIENGQKASGETLKALANAFNVDVFALSVDPEIEAAQIVQSRQAKVVRDLRLSFWIHGACYVVVAAVFITISVGLGAFVMKWPLMWVTVALLGHGAVLAVVELVVRYDGQRDYGS
jgi:transcriptional regulator with XRE-family HTH domain